MLPPLPRRAFVAVASTAVLALTASGCAAFSDDTEATSVDGERSVVAAFYPLQYVTQRVAGDPESGAVEVIGLTQPGGEPHDLELAPRQTAEISAADLVVYLSQFQPAVDDSVEANAAGVTLDVGSVADLLAVDEDEAEHDAHSDEEEGHGDEDPHFWHDPARMADVGDAVEEQLGELDPDNAESYATNADSLRSELETLDDEYATTLENCDRDTVVVSHDAFGYLAKYDLAFESINGLSPGAEPTPADLARLQDLIQDDGITTVFSERLVSARLAESLAADAGVDTAVLDPIEGLSDETADEDYLSLMRTNLEALAVANGCS